jgi:hypothetical protein
MRKLLLACALLIGISTAAGAVLPSRPYVGLYADAAHGVTSLNPVPFTSFQIWIWWLPSEHGLMATEYRVAMPSNVIALSTVSNPALQVLLGCPSIGENYLCAVFSSCTADWVYTHQLTCMLMAPTPGFIEVLPRLSESVIWAANCEEGYPVEPVTILNRFGVNQDGVIAVEPESWGAIKSLYR